MNRLLAFASVLFASAACAQGPPVDPFAHWEREIAGIGARLREAPPKAGGVLFAGSSSIRLWDVPKSFPDLPALNVGFGGSEIRDSTHFAARLIVPHKPGAIVFYAGDNDIAKGRTPKQTADDFAEFATAIRAELPKCRILFIAIKPSVSRWKLYGKQTEANALIRELCKKDDALVYVDVVPAMLGENGEPIPELFQKDGLHMTAKGYAIWTEAAKKALAAK